AAEGELANYAKGASVTVSSTETDDLVGELAVDGDMATRWASQYTDDEQITIDLGAIKPIGYIELYWETALASDFEIYTGSSADNLQEHTIATVTGNADTHNVFEFDLTTARYITIHCSKRATEWGNSLYEVIVRKSADEVVSFAGPEGYPSSGCEVPDGSVIINGARIGLEEGWGGNAAAGRDAAFDGDINTFFDPLGTGNGWAGIDAGEEYTLTKIMIHPRDGQLPRFNGAEIDGSNDPEFEDYTPLWISVEEADEFKWYEINEADFDDHGSFRYYRYFNGTNHGDVADVELYGYPTAGGPGSAALAVEKTLTMPKTEFADDEPILVTATGEGKDWVGVYKEGDVPGDAGSTAWYYVVDANGEEHAIIDSLPAGNYFMGLYANDGYDEIASMPFTVTGEAPVAPGFATADEAVASIEKTAISGYEFTAGSEGAFGGEGPENLWDGDTATKLCTNTLPASSTAKLDDTYAIDGVVIALANDNAQYGRIPTAWTLSGSNDGENWTEITSGDDTMFVQENGDFRYFAKSFDASPAYSYVKIEIPSSTDEIVQISEVVLTGAKASAADEALDAKEEAPNTFDFGVIAAVAAVISLGGFAVSKKKH
ncbi:MAG: discoidin domain-containing protein, partial [Clostridia bacterium]|nr:discoidin domain-containing protein [Clostridia bacterium]